MKMQTSLCPLKKYKNYGILTWNHFLKLSAYRTNSQCQNTIENLFEKLIDR